MRLVTQILIVFISLVLFGCGRGMCPFAGCPRVSSGSSWSAPLGIIDTTFGTSGNTSIEMPVTDYQTILGSAIQSDGKILLVGGNWTGGFNRTIIARFLTTGALDTGFGTSGYRLVDITPGANNYHQGVALDSSGNIYTVGFSNSGTQDLNVLKFTSAGALDTSFATSGIYTYNTGANEVGYAIAIQPDGKIVVAGGIGANTIVIRLNTNGSADGTFGVAGVRTITYAGGSSWATSLKILSSGKILVGGTASNGGDNDFAICRLLSDGTVDGTFGTAGKTITDFAAADDSVSSILTQTDGKIILAGSSNMFAAELARYSADGVLDTTYGTSGIFIYSWVNIDQIAAAAIQPDDKVIVAGRYNGARYRFAASRVTSSGAVDTTFGTSGYLTIAPVYAAGADDYCTNMIFDVSHSIFYLTGHTDYTNMSLAKYK